jgi:protein-S-isoprenylcysteine O-methyltransferase Ste14
MGDKIRDFIPRRRVTLSFLFALFFILMVYPPSMLFLVVGLEVAFFGEAIRIWAAGYVRKGELLTVNGPYSYVRYPLYLGNFLIGCGFCIAVQSLNFFIIFMVLFGLIYRYTLANEQKKLTEKFGVEFVSYRDNVPAFFPAVTPYRTNVMSRFSWKLVLENNEYRAWIGIAVVGTILVLRLLGINLGMKFLGVSPEVNFMGIRVYLI